MKISNIEHANYEPEKKGYQPMWRLDFDSVAFNVWIMLSLVDLSPSKC